MSKERDSFRYHLADLKKTFPNTKLISRRQLAAYLGVNESTIYTWDLPLIDTGKSKVLPIISVARWLSGSKVDR